MVCAAVLVCSVFCALPEARSKSRHRILGNEPTAPPSPTWHLPQELWNNVELPEWALPSNFAYQGQGTTRSPYVARASLKGNSWKAGSPRASAEVSHFRPRATERILSPKPDPDFHYLKAGPIERDITRATTREGRIRDSPRRIQTIFGGVAKWMAFFFFLMWRLR